MEGSSSMMMMDSICLYFYQSQEVYFLFKEWHIKKLGPYIACLLVSFFLGYLLELITFSLQQIKSRLNTSYRINKLILVETANRSNTHLSDTSYGKLSSQRHKLRINWELRICIALLFLVQLFLAYTLMLIIMTYNFLLFLFPILGMLAGYITIQFIHPIMKSNDGEESRSLMNDSLSLDH